MAKEFRESTLELLKRSLNVIIIENNWVELVKYVYGKNKDNLKVSQGYKLGKISLKIY